MSREILVWPEAEADLSDAYAWYEDKVRDLGDDFLDEVRRTLGLIRENPFLYQEVEQGVHRALVRRFPYSVYFFVSIDLITVVAVLHLSRRPGTWKNRL